MKNRGGAFFAGGIGMGVAIGVALGLALDKPVLGVHHLEGHLLSPLLAKRSMNTSAASMR